MIARTVTPRQMRLAVRCRPMNPVAPVTATVPIRFRSWMPFLPKSSHLARAVAADYLIKYQQWLRLITSM